MTGLQDRQIAVVGVGLMGGLLLDRLLTAGTCTKEHIIACEPRPERREAIAERHGVSVTSDNRRATEADVIILAVPPGDVLPVLCELVPRLRMGHLVVSVAAAVRLGAMERVVGDEVAVVWALPNSPALIGEGVTPVVYSRKMAPETRALAEALLACWGEAVEVPDDMMNLCVGLTAAAPTYVFPIIEALAEAGVRGGFPRDLAVRLAAGVVRGSGALVLETGLSPKALAGLTPLQPLREAETKALFAEAVEVACGKMDRLQGRLAS
ncbi:MAG: NAD(P)-binding domain-containing protein [Anaerolineae bacterium]|jgi:pyrroline-5-carboxylate reductase